MDQSVSQRFHSRAGLLLSALGIAVGTGNIWRFPRIAAQSGGEEGAGALIVAWIIFLFLWSIPLIIAEYLMGRKHRKGVVGAFVLGMGKRFAWMGAFVGFVATAISFFYAVIVGWALYYFLRMTFFSLPTDTFAANAIWDNFQASNWPFIVHFVAVFAGGIAILKGIKSIERINKILIPVLFLIILLSVVRAVTLPGATDGIAFLFKVDFQQLLQPDIWLQALTQNAWDTGAGWGLFLCYGAYMQARHGTVKNAFITGIGNNIISLLMAVMIFGTVFSILKAGDGMNNAEVLEVMKTSGPASTGLTFIWLPQLFARMEAGGLLSILFFLGLTFAGFSSLISMLELASRSLVDRGWSRKKSVLIITTLVYLLGIPSVMSLNFLSNQDFVWGLGLIISGLFIALLVIRQGPDKLRTLANANMHDFNLKKIWSIQIQYFVPVAAILLLIWWIWLSISTFAPDTWYNPFSPYSVMSCLAQWLLIAGLFWLFNKKTAKLAS